MSNSRIEIKDLSVMIHIGVTETERIKEQEILITVEIIPFNYPPEDDNIESAVNYSTIREEIIEIAKNSKFRLIESLAKMIANNIKNKYNLKQISVTIKKFPYSDVKYVGFSITI